MPAPKSACSLTRGAGARLAQLGRVRLATLPLLLALTGCPADDGPDQPPRTDPRPDLLAGQGVDWDWAVPACQATEVALAGDQPIRSCGWDKGGRVAVTHAFARGERTGDTRYGRDAAGRLVVRQVLILGQRDKLERLRYDAAGRLAHVDLDDDGDARADRAIDYQRDAAGRVLVRSEDPIPPGPRLEEHWDYEGGRAVGYRMGHAGVAGLLNQWSWDYDGDGRIITGRGMTWGDHRVGVTRYDYTYEAGRVHEERRDTWDDGTIDGARVFRWDDDGHLLETADGPPGAPVTRVAYTWSQDRLASIASDHPAWSIRFDPAESGIVRTQDWDGDGTTDVATRLDDACPQAVREPCAVLEPFTTHEPNLSWPWNAEH